MAFEDTLRAESVMRARSAFEQALQSGVTPDQAAERFRVAREMQVPVATVDSVTPAERAAKTAGAVPWETEAVRQPTLMRYLTDADFANFVKDDVTNTGAMESLWWKLSGEGGEPEWLGASARNSMARGGYGLVNTLPGAGNADRLLRYRRALARLDEIEEGIAQGKSDTEIFGVSDPRLAAVRRAQHNVTGKAARRRLNQLIQDASESMAWANSMIQRFPQSAAMAEFAQQKTAARSVAWALRHPLELLANTGPESLVQFAPAVAGLAATRGAGLGALMPLVAGAYSYNLDANAELTSGILDALSESGVSTTDPEAIAEFIKNDPRFAGIVREAQEHAVPVAILDAISMGLAGKALPKTLPDAFKRVAPSTSRAYATVMDAPYRARLLNLAAQTGLQGTLGATGEALGQLNAEGEVSNWGDVVAEFAGEAFTAPVEVMTATVSLGRDLFTRKAEAQARRQNVAELTERARNSKVIARDPVTAKAFFQAVEKIAPGASDFYVPFSALQQDGLAEELSAINPEMAARVQEALQTGGSLRIGYAEYAADVAPLPVADKLIGVMTQEGAPTEAEVDDIVQSVAEDADAAIADAARSAGSPFAQSLRTVGKTVDAMLNGAVGLPARSRGAYKTLLVTLTGNLARDAGMTPEEVWHDFGLQGVLGATDVARADDGTVAAVSDRAKALLKNRASIDLDQEDSKKARGAFFKESRVIALYTDANRSTFLHESGHWFLDARVRLSQALLARGGELTEGQRYLVDVTVDALKTFGIDGLDAYANASEAQLRKVHEAFARTYEQYLYEGRAPTAALRTLFRRFSAWLRQVYGAIKAIPGSQMSDEVAALFDRLFTAREQALEAQTLRGFNRALDLGLADAENPAEAIDQWVRTFAEARGLVLDEATEQLVARGMRDMAYLRNLRGRVTRGFEREAERLRKALRPEVHAELMKNHTYALIDLLKNGKEVDGSRRAVRLYVDDLKAAGVTDDKIARLTEMGFTVKTRVRSRIAPDELAQGFNFSSVSAMADALFSAKPNEETLNDAIEARMLDEHGELSTEGAIRRLADEAVFNPSLARMVAAEINFLESAGGRRGERRVTAAMFRDAAAAFLRNKTVGSLRPRAARDDAARLGREAQAALAGRTADPAEAIGLKRKQLFQTQVAILSQRVLDASTRARDHLRRRFDGRKELKSVDTKCLIQMQALMYALGVTDTAPRTPAPAYDEFARAQYDDNGVLFPMMPESVRELLPGLNHPERTAFEDLTVAQAEDVLTFLGDVEQAARDATRVMVGARALELATVRETLTNALNARAEAIGRKHELPNELTGWKARVRDALAKIGIAHRRIPSLLASMEGTTTGAFFEYVVRPFDQAATKEQALRTEFAIKMQKAMKPLAPLLRDHGPGKHFADLGASLNGQQLVAAALNLGNAVNMQRLIDGSDQYGWTDAGGNGERAKWSVEALKDVIARELTPEQLQALQAVWDTCGELWPQVVALEERMGHRPPVRQEPQAVTFVRPDGTEVTLAGGYYPIKYDRKANEESRRQDDEARQAATGLQGFGSAYATATTYQGFVKERSATAAGRPISLTDRAGFEGLDAVIHDLAFREAVVSAQKIFAPRGSVAKTIRELWGPTALDGVRRWIADAAMGDSRQTNGWDDAARLIRQHVSLAGIGLNFLTAAIQLTGMTQTVALLGPKFSGIGIAEYLRNPIAATRDVREKSAFMSQRAQTMFRELREVQARLNGNIGSVREKIMRAAYVPVTMMQTVVDVPSWLGAYNRALSEGRTDADAIAIADRFVADAQGSGRSIDLSAIERDPSAWAQLFTVFYTFFNAAYNAARIIGDTRKGMSRAAGLLTLLVLQPVLDTFLRTALTPTADDGDDWMEKLLREAAANTVSFNLGMFVGLRELGNIGGYFFGTDAYPYRGPAGLRTITDIDRLARQLAQGEIDEGLVLAIVSVMGVTAGFPVVPVTRAIKGYEALESGKTDNPLVLILGYSDH